MYWDLRKKELSSKDIFMENDLDDKSANKNENDEQAENPQEKRNSEQEKQNNKEKKEGEEKMRITMMKIIMTCNIMKSI